LQRSTKFFQLKIKEIPMSTLPNKNLMKKLVSIAGVASATVALSFPAFAVTNADATRSNQFNNQAYRTDSSVSSKNLLAQSSGSEPSNTDGSRPTNLPTNMDGSGTNQMPPMDGSGTNQSPSMPTMDGSGSTTQPSSTGESNINQRSTTGGINNTLPSNTGGSNRTTTDGTNATTGMSNQGENNRMRRLVTGGDSVRGVIYQCLNNPNPNCGM
jgi:hypothetical protein